MLAAQLDQQHRVRLRKKRLAQRLEGCTGMERKEVVSSLAVVTERSFGKSPGLVHEALRIERLRHDGRLSRETYPRSTGMSPGRRNRAPAVPPQPLGDGDELSFVGPACDDG